MPIILVADWHQVPCPRVLHIVRSVVVDANVVYGAFHHPGLFIAEQWQPILDNLLHRVWVPSIYNGVKEPPFAAAWRRLIPLSWPCRLASAMIKKKPQGRKVPV